MHPRGLIQSVVMTFTLFMLTNCSKPRLLDPSLTNQNFVSISSDSLVIGLPPGCDLVAYGWITPGQWFVVAQPVHPIAEQLDRLGRQYRLWLGPSQHLQPMSFWEAGRGWDDGTMLVYTDLGILYLPDASRGDVPDLNGQAIHRVFDPSGILNFPATLARH